MPKTAHAAGRLLMSPAIWGAGVAGGARPPWAARRVRPVAVTRMAAIAVPYGLLTRS